MLTEDEIMAEVVERFTTLTGKAPLAPERRIMQALAGMICDLQAVASTTRLTIRLPCGGCARLPLDEAGYEHVVAHLGEPVVIETVIETVISPQEMYLAYRRAYMQPPEGTISAAIEQHTRACEQAAMLLGVTPDEIAAVVAG
jgi:hypothetical protein